MREEEVEGMEEAGGRKEEGEGWRVEEGVDLSKLVILAGLSEIS